MTNLKELFPTYGSLSIFLAYMVFCVGQGILITASRAGATGYNYSTIAAVLLTEIVKLFMAIACYLHSNTLSSLLPAIRKDLRVCMLYLIPSFLYCIYNNLAFVNLAAFDPTTYYLLLQLRVVVTGVIFQVIFSKKLSAFQWFSLILLTLGCMLQQLDWDRIAGSTDSAKNTSGSTLRISFNLLLILLQTACSCLAGVYNEYLLKGERGDRGEVNIFIQNIFMYIDSIIWNVVLLAEQGALLDSISPSSLESLMRPLVIILIVNNALIGITTSLFLKSLNSILKTFASALELIFTAILSYLFFGLPVKPNTWAAISVVSYAVYLYSRHPITSPLPSSSVKNLKDGVAV